MREQTAHRSRAFVLMLIAACGGGAAWADMNGGRASPAARYEVERATCLRGESNQDPTTCLREAGAAYDQARRAGTHDDDPAQLEANRLQRCVPLPAELRRDCVARMQGQGTISGSVAGGGIYRELVTIVDDDASSDRGPPQR